VIRYICWTPQRRDAFIHLCQHSQPDEPTFLPIAANLTRWNSDFLAIRRALQLRNPLELFISRHQWEGLSKDQLDPEDWKELQDILAILQPFHKATLGLEGHRGNGVLYEIFPVMDTLLEHLENAKQLYTASESTPYLLQSIDLSWKKLNKYYALTEFNPVLYAAVALHPSMKYEYFEIAWEAWIVQARTITTQLWRTFASSQASVTSSTTSMQNTSRSSSATTVMVDQPTPDSALTSWKNKRRPRQSQNRDELDEFTTTDTIDSLVNPRIWWIQHKNDYPKLALLALGILAIPAMSAEVERVFSSTGLLITDRRNRLKEDIIEAVECLKSWQKEGAGIVMFKELDQLQDMLTQLEQKANLDGVSEST